MKNPAATVVGDSFSGYLKRFREENGLRKKEVASLLGVHFGTYCSWECGKNTPHEVTQEGSYARIELRRKLSK